MRTFAISFVVALAMLADDSCSSSRRAIAGELLGLDLFVRKWVAHDPRSLPGDGVGPMHNATSCAACHNQQGPGGGGGREHNVELLSIVPVNAAPGSQQRREFVEALQNLHPGFLDPQGNVRPNIVLHRFGPEADYYDLRAKLLGSQPSQRKDAPKPRTVTVASVNKQKSQRNYVEDLPPIDGVFLRRSQRNTPALWGAGLIDSIHDRAIEEGAKEQARRFPELSGSAPKASGGGLGRFGWRGQTGSLREFVLIACANELGLQTSTHEQPVNPVAPRYKAAGNDLTEDYVNALVAYISNLPRPVQRNALNSSERSVQHGQEVFEKIGCAGCHSRRLGHVEGLFSDLLLHDMGAELQDPVEANPTALASPRPFASYYGTGRVFTEGTATSAQLAREWRTPPLWGVADSAPYMHDGRADTLVEAIGMHGGEAQKSANRFRDLNVQDRNSVIAFLQSLAAP